MGTKMSSLIQNHSLSIKENTDHIISDFVLDSQYFNIY